MAQQLVKKSNGGYEKVMPKSWIDAIVDKSTGKTLADILQSFNMYFLSYSGNIMETRCQVPSIIRKKGLWITYVKYDGKVYTEWYAASAIDDKSWGDSSNWRVANNTLVGDISISANGNWVINGEETVHKAIGERGDTPMLRVYDNKLQVSYDEGDTWTNVTENPVYTKFRWTSSSPNVGRIQASTDDGKTWVNLSNDFTNNLHIKKYIGADETLPTTGVAEGTIYMKGPYYSASDTLQEYPSYRMWIYAYKGNTLAWQDNGEFQSIAAGISQEEGNDENVVMSQKATTDSLKRVSTNVGIEEYSQFSTSKDYSIGDKVLYEGALYKFTSEHVKGTAWDWNEVVAWSEKKEREELALEVGDLAEKMGLYKGLTKVGTILFTSDEVPDGYTIVVSFKTTVRNGNVVVRNAEGNAIKNFQIHDGEIGQIYPKESYILPPEYRSVEVGGYGNIELDLVVYSLLPSSQAKELKLIEEKHTIQAEQINTIRGELLVEGAGETTNLYPESIDEGKFLDYNGEEADSTLQNVANFDVSNIQGVELLISAWVSTNPNVCYLFTRADGKTNTGTVAENGGKVATHTLTVPFDAETLRFSYFPEHGISASYNKPKSLKDYVLEDLETEIQAFKDAVSAQNIAVSLAGSDALSISVDSLSDNLLTMEGVPTYTKKDCILSFKADITKFNSISFGLGYGTVRGLHVTIDDTYVTCIFASSERIKEAHNLSIGTFVRCSVFHEMKKYKFVISSIGGTYYREHNETDIYFAEVYGVPYIYADSGTSLTNVKLSRTGSDFKKPVWVFGDSYTSFDAKRWPYYIINYGFSNFMLCGLAGATSSQMYEQFLNCLKFGTPKYVLWCLGMNDGSGLTPYQTYYEKVKAICEEKGIELILQTIPNVPNINKEAINSIIKASGLRYVDAAEAVGSYNNPNWYDGYLDDGVHPTELGAKAIASQVLTDFPEIMQY